MQLAILVLNLLQDAFVHALDTSLLFVQVAFVIRREKVLLSFRSHICWFFCLLRGYFGSCLHFVTWLIGLFGFGKRGEPLRLFVRRFLSLFSILLEVGFAAGGFSIVNE